jgi:hypothetical protein
VTRLAGDAEHRLGIGTDAEPVLGFPGRATARVAGD